MNDDCRDLAKEAFKQVYDSKWYILGKFLEDFESRFASYIGTKHAIGVGNGFDALRIAFRALGIKKGDEVIVPAHTFIATITAVVDTGAVPVLCDVDPQTFNIDINSAESLVKPNTRIIVPVHLYGNPADIPSIKRFSQKHSLQIVEDYAQSAGAVVGGCKTGSIGDINASSFYPVKNLGALGDGGIITTNDDGYDEFCRIYRNYGGKGKFDFEIAGINSRLDELQAALLTVKLKFLDQWIDEKAKIAERYVKNLCDLKPVQLPVTGKESISSWHIFPLLSERRNELQNYLGKNGIGTLVHYPVPCHLQPALKSLGYKRGDFPVTEMISDKELSLPIYPGLTQDQVDYISECILDFFKMR
jgi:dTDP-4-amino-4,6-dideoxygalactose transaminase